MRRPVLREDPRGFRGCWGILQALFMDNVELLLGFKQRRDVAVLGFRTPVQQTLWKMDGRGQPGALVNI